MAGHYSQKMAKIYTHLSITSVESCMKCRQRVATPCLRLHFHSHSLITLSTYSLFGLATGNHQLVFYPAIEHELDIRLKVEIMVL